MNTKVGEWQEVMPEEQFFNKYAVEEEEDEDEMDEEFIRPQEDKFDRELEKAEGNIAIALESVIGGKDKSKNFIELAKKNIDLDFAEDEQDLQYPPENESNLLDKPVMFKKKGGDNKKKRETIKVNLEDV